MFLCNNNWALTYIIRKKTWLWVFCFLLLILTMNNACLVPVYCTKPDCFSPMSNLILYQALFIRILIISFCYVVYQADCQNLHLFIPGFIGNGMKIDLLWFSSISLLFINLVTLSILKSFNSLNISMTTSCGHVVIVLAHPRCCPVFYVFSFVMEEVQYFFFFHKDLSTRSFYL